MKRQKKPDRQSKDPRPEAFQSRTIGVLAPMRGAGTRLGWTAIIAAVSLTGCIHHTAKVPPVPAGSSPFADAFDLTWDLKTGLDANGVPLNPKWAPQLNPTPERPDFQGNCSKAITDGGTNSDPGNLKKYCTTQEVALDVRPKTKSDPASKLICPAQPMRGHMNWGVVTYSGQIQFVGWSTNFWILDDDLSFTLATPDSAGLTNVGDGVHMEFRASETVDQFGNSNWWQAFGHAVHSLPFLPAAAGKAVDGRLAVVTGLVGIDGVHGGKTESHPVYALAILSEQAQVNGKIEEKWKFFLRNHGTEGDCSRMEHAWADFHGSYYIQFPWPDGAEDVSVLEMPTAWSYLDDKITGVGLRKPATAPCGQAASDAPLSGWMWRMGVRASGRSERLRWITLQVGQQRRLPIPPRCAR